MMRILGIIPARGGSKGIPRKNLVDVCGRPLIAWTIESGKQLLANGVLARCIVSTDDDEIAAVARAHGADVPFLRPTEAATDSAKALAYVLHALDTLEPTDGAFDAVMILQPTSPRRHPAAIAEAVARLAVSDAESLISCYQEDYINELVMYEDEGDGRIRPRHPNHNKGVRRQEHGPTMVRNGAIYVTRVPYLRATGQLVCNHPVLLRMEKIESIDVDTPDDLELLRVVLCR
ncbi:acylneuraminate cytidylyltransferase family protein [Synechococcus sp. HJ21-Hayes]|jgi:CMP-N,N'-diacetyllegionaminic acid synthase|uniref:acylneuraminate cytidylyltransferase family protein n=2 Tax=unclassified Synechococcus TaxID=2626047 RepID=UPI0020CD1D47|nr:acylneuraminate cytidylyltransferase family protein [Synechococcus sp. JJ3a-Johnson]MCP9830084.1 acylneuraminate cytidylyltransferase family protein [Synechococcus sp. JJ3a-Johnson]MCP9852108.1 acylneuraminate cytidylyltransferase family protein [Synechococcus sp. HJ21-Hayes]